MSVTFDAIRPLPSPEEQQKANALRQVRQSRQARAAELRRAQLLVVAWDMLKELGLAGFNMRALGLRAGYTAGAMYGYFASRDHILQALHERWMEELSSAVTQVRWPRRTRRTTSDAGAESPVGARGHGVDAVADARERFLVRSEVWWNHLTREAFAVPLLLLHGEQHEAGSSASGLIEADADKSWPNRTPLGSLELATHACVQDLEVAGWAPDRALRLQRDALCLGVGLAVLGGVHGRDGEPVSSSPAADGFRQTLECWLHRGDAPARVQGRTRGGGQPDLFAGGHSG